MLQPFVRKCGPTHRILPRIGFFFERPFNEPHRQLVSVLDHLCDLRTVASHPESLLYLTRPPVTTQTTLHRCGKLRRGRRRKRLDWTENPNDVPFRVGLRSTVTRLKGLDHPRERPRLHPTLTQQRQDPQKSVEISRLPASRQWCRRHADATSVGEDRRLNRGVLAASCVGTKSIHPESETFLPHFFRFVRMLGNPGLQNIQGHVDLVGACRDADKGAVRADRQTRFNRIKPLLFGHRPHQHRHPWRRSTSDGLGGRGRLRFGNQSGRQHSERHSNHSGIDASRFEQRLDRRLHHQDGSRPLGFTQRTLT